MYSVWDALPYPIVSNVQKLCFIRQSFMLFVACFVPESFLYYLYFAVKLKALICSLWYAIRVAMIKSGTLCELLLRAQELPDSRNESTVIVVFDLPTVRSGDSTIVSPCLHVEPLWPFVVQYPNAFSHSVKSIVPISLSPTQSNQ